MLLNRFGGNSKLVFTLLVVIAIVSFLIAISSGTVDFTITESVKAIFVNDDSMQRLIVFDLRLPRVLTAGLVGIGLALSGAMLQGLMRNNMASPSIIGVTSGASFIGYLTLVVFPRSYYLLTPATIIGAFLTTMLIYRLAYQRGVSPVKMILSGIAVSAIFGAFNDIIKLFYSEDIANATGFIIGGFNGVVWKHFFILFPFTLIALIATVFLPTYMNVLLLGDDVAGSLGLNVQRFRLLLIVISSLLAGSAVAISGLIGFVGLVVPHITRMLLGSDYKHLFPGSVLIGFSLMIMCDTIGRIILPVGEIPVGIIMAAIGAPFFLYLLRTRETRGV